MNNEIDFEKWELAIGKIVLAGSRVEYELIRLYEKHLPERDYFSDGYLDRYDKAIGFCKKSLNDGFLISRRLIEMKKVAELRHLVAHNPIHYYAPDDTWCIFDNKNQEQKITLQELEKEALRLWDISVGLSALLRISV